MTRFLVAQLTDLHIQPAGILFAGRIDTGEYLRRAIAQLNAEQPAPDLILVTGDLVEAGTMEEYERAHELLAALGAPYYVIPGNHDDRAILAKVFHDHCATIEDENFVQYVIEDLPLRLIGLDTLAPGKPYGMLCPKRLAWLEATLAMTLKKPTIIFMHHPPFATGINFMDQMGLENPDDLARMLRKYDNIERVLCGHIHRNVTTRFAGSIAAIAGSTAHQIALLLAPDAAGAMSLEPPSYQLHLFDPADGLVSHIVSVGDFSGPIRFGT